MHDSCAKYARLDLEPRPSRRLTWLLAAAHTAGAACLWLTGLPLWVCGLGTLLVSAEWYRVRRQVVSDRSVRVLWENGQWRLIDRGGESGPVALCGDSYVHPQLIILNFRLPRRRRRSVVLLSDSLPAQDLRRLRVVLRTGGGRAAAGAGLDV